MSPRRWTVIILALAVLASEARGQNADLPPPPGGPAPGAGIPNLNGVWGGPSIVAEAALRRALGGRLPPFTPYGQEQWDNRNLLDDPTAACLPSGFGRIFHSPLDFQIIQTDGQVVFLFETYMQYHRVYTDGRRPPENYEPTWWGYSVGRYEENKLIVQTAGTNGNTWLFTAGIRHSDQLRMTHVFEKTGPDTIQVTEVFEDPVYFTEPWSIAYEVQRRDYDFIEMVCMENNRDLNFLLQGSGR